MTTETSGSGTRVAGDEIATVVLEAFDALPKKRKPQARKDGVREWVPLSGIVAQGSAPRARISSSWTNGHAKQIWTE
jgi:hypothetical protein